MRMTTGFRTCSWRAKTMAAVAGFLVLLFLPVSALAIIDAALQMQLGNPSAATTNAANTNNYLMTRPVEALAYANPLGQPRWTSWDLTAADMGSVTRSTSFYVDTNLPAAFYRVKTTDYNNSGFDRGHMCTSEDRTDTTNNNKMVFFMSNIVPQSPDNNQGPWASFENYCQALAVAGNEMLIVSGPSAFTGGTLLNSNKVAIPGYTWKVAVVVPAGSGTALSRITADTRVIAVKMPNVAGIRSVPWTNYVTSAQQIQTDTGYTFFTALPSNVASILRAKVDGVSAPKVVISQVYGGGGNAGAPYKNDFIELYNSGSATADLSTYAVQYAAATGSTWSKTPLTGTLAPGKYYLIQEAGGTNGVALPTPQVTGTISMAATAGKVALTTTQTTLTVSNPVGLAEVADFIGFGTTANAYEGTGPAPAPSNTTADLRASGGATDTNNNATDFTAGAVNPRNN